jgi:hypothetical protein
MYVGNCFNLGRYRLERGLAHAQGCKTLVAIDAIRARERIGGVFVAQDGEPIDFSS